MPNVRISRARRRHCRHSLSTRTLRNGFEAPPGDPADDLAAIRINLFQGGPGAPFMSEWFEGRDFASFLPLPAFFGPLMPFVMSVQATATGAFMLMSRDTGPLYKISFGSGGDSRLVELAQSNALTDIDTLLAIDLLTDTRIAQESAFVLTDDDERSARNAMPIWASDLPGQGISFPAFLVGEAETAFAAQNAGDTDETAAPAPRDGVFRDGARIEADERAGIAADHHFRLSGALDPDAETGAEIQLMARPAPDAFGTAAASGSNVLVNEAALIDALIPARTLAVMGDVFQRDAIMQINVHSNTDIVAMNGADPVGDEGSGT